MRIGTIVRVRHLRSERGVLFDSVREECKKKIKGKVVSERDELNCVSVKFPTCEGPMDLPIDILETA